MDDEDILREIVGQLLEALGYEAGFASNGEEAIEVYDQALRSGEPFDAVILDLTVKGSMGGQETIEQLLAMDPQVKAIVSSGYSHDPILSDHERYGFKGVISKPYEISALGRVLERVASK